MSLSDDKDPHSASKWSPHINVRHGITMQLLQLISLLSAGYLFVLKGFGIFAGVNHVSLNGTSVFPVALTKEDLPMSSTCQNTNGLLPGIHFKIKPLFLRYVRDWKLLFFASSAYTCNSEFPLTYVSIHLFYSINQISASIHSTYLSVKKIKGG